MTIQTRLQKVTQSLSPQQRIALMLAAQKEGREPDPDLGRFDDPQQSKAFNRYVALLYVINRELGALCYIHHGFTQSLDNSAEQVRLLQSAATLLEEQEGLEPVKRPRDWRRCDEIGVPEFLRSVAAELRVGLADAIALRWRELRALEQVWAELAQEFAGEDPLSPELGHMAAEAKETLRSLATEMRCRRRLSEPDEALLAEVRHGVDAAFGKLEPLL